MYAAVFESRKAGVIVKVFGVGCRSVLSQLYNDGILCCTILFMHRLNQNTVASSSMSCLSMDRHLVSIQRLGIIVVNDTSMDAGRICTCV